MITPYTLPGFMELLPKNQVQFNKIYDTIRSTYERYGFLPLDTPIIEGADILLAKAGGETEKQIYQFQKGDNNLCLRFDLTVPLAKYVAMNQGQLVFPFRRYQIGKVYRGEKAQRGRYREFYQCDLDVLGDGELSNVYDAEIPCIIKDIFDRLGLKFIIKINNRKILNGLFAYYNIDNKADVMRIIDKIDKIGESGVRECLADTKLDTKTIDALVAFISIQGDNRTKLAKAKALGIDNEEYNLGLQELSEVVEYAGVLGGDDNFISIDYKIARGLDYYTGTVYETFLIGNENVGSVCSGGRYDNLAGYYTTKKYPGVGISIGLTRLFYVLGEIGKLQQAEPLTKVLVVPMTSNEMEYALKVAKAIRDNNINCEVYLEDKKFKNKLNYANRQEVPYVAIVGEEEVINNTVTLKDMQAHTQQTIELTCISQPLK